MNQTNLPTVIQTAAKELQVNLDEVNLLLPTQTFGQVLGRYDRVTLEVIAIDPDPKKGKDVYETDGGLALAKRPLDLMANALAVIWDPHTTGIIYSDKMKSRAKATGAYRKPNGEWVPWTEEKTIDCEVYGEKMRLAYEEKAEKGNFTKIKSWGETNKGKKYPIFESWKDDQEKQDCIDRAVARAVLQRREFKDELAMSGAKERVIRHMISMKSSYSAEELRKPFAVPRVITDVDKMLENPEVREEALRRMSGAVSSIFGPGNGGRRERNITPERQAIEEDAGLEIPASEVHEVPEEPLPTFDAPEEPPQEESKEQAIRQRLQQYVDDSAYDVLGKATSPAGKSARDLVKELLARSDATLDDLAVMDARVQDYLAKVGGGLS